MFVDSNLRGSYSTGTSLDFVSYQRISKRNRSRPSTQIKTAFIDIRTKRLATFRVNYLPRLSTLRFFNKCTVPFF
jgi:hypothetical protein